MFRISARSDVGYLKVTVRGGRARASDRERTMSFHWAASGTKPFDQPEPQ